jgi:hypothetical protein
LSKEMLTEIALEELIALLKDNEAWIEPASML